MTIEELNVELNEGVKKGILNAVGSVKKYVDGRDEVLKSEITEELVKELSEIDGLGKQLEKIQEMANAFSKVFDENEDGSITPEEILAKAVLLQQAIDGVNGRVDSLTTDLNTYVSEITKAVTELEARVKSNELNIAKNTEEIANIKVGYVKTEDLAKVKIDVDAISKSVEDLLFPSTTDGDAAVE